MWVKRRTHHPPLSWTKEDWSRWNWEWGHDGHQSVTKNKSINMWNGVRVLGAFSHSWAMSGTVFCVLCTGTYGKAIYRVNVIYLVKLWDVLGHGRRLKNVSKIAYFYAMYKALGYATRLSLAWFYKWHKSRSFLQNIPWVPEGFFSVVCCETERRSRDRGVAREKRDPLVTAVTNLTSMRFWKKIARQTGFLYSLFVSVISYDCTCCSDAQKRAHNMFSSRWRVMSSVLSDSREKDNIACKKCK